VIAGKHIFPYFGSIKKTDGRIPPLKTELKQTKLSTS